MRATSAALAFFTVVMIVALMAIYETRFHETNRAGGWAVGFFSGLFIGAFGVWAAGQLSTTRSP